MENIKDYDDEGFELQFEDDTPPEEKKYYVQTYTNVNMVADRRLHCSCCDTHIGTAPAAEKIIRMHPVLRVTQCVRCYRFYNSGEFEKGEDGSELYCRWCGQGGDVYCCSDCPYVFCKKCILRNLTKVALKDVTSNDNWKCFSCAPKILYHLRAQHWALVNFIAKQKEKIEAVSKKRDQDEIADAMNQDVSQCCKNKRKTVETKKRKLTASDHSDNESVDSNRSSRKKIQKKTPSVKEDSGSETATVDEKSPKRKKVEKKPITVTAQEAAVSSIEKNPQIQVKKVTAASTNVGVRKTPPSTSISGPSKHPAIASTDPTEIDCTPDLFSFLVNHSFEQTFGAVEQSENSVSSSTGVRAPPANQAKEPEPNLPAVQRVAGNQGPPNREQLVRRVVRNRDETAPVYHTYNGYRIDLNSASQQSTVRLPNGKVIHVKKQTPLDSRHTTRYSISPQVPQQPRLPQPRAMTNQNARDIPRPVPFSMQRIGPPPAPAPAPMSLRMNGPRIRGPSVRPPPPLAVPVRQPSNQAVDNHLRSLALQQAQMRMHNIQTAPPQMVQMPTVSAGPSMVNNPTASNIPMPRVYSNDPVGRARTQLERQIFNSIQICQQIEGKLKTLMNSNAYKNVQKLNDIKELYIHLSYLFTYTNGRFQSVHDKCMDDMRRLGFKNDATSLSSGNVIDINKQNKGDDEVDADDLEIVEPNHATINLDSDDERTPEKNKSKSNPSSARQRTPNTNSVTPPALNTSAENLECEIDVSSLLQCQLNDEDDYDDDENGLSLLTRMNDDVDGIATPPDFEQTENNVNVNVQNDVKLNSNVVVSLKLAEKEFPDLVEKAMKKLKEDQDENAQPPEQSEKQPIEIESESETSKEKIDDENVIENPDQSKENDIDRPECTNTTSSKEISLSIEEIVNLDETDKGQQNDKNEENEVSADAEVETENKSDDENASNEKVKEIPEEVESMVNDKEQDQDVECIENEAQEPESLDDSGETASSPHTNEVATNTNEVSNSNENEAKSTDNNSDCEKAEAPVQESVSEITSTSMASESSNEAVAEVSNENDVELNETENDVEMNDNDKTNNQEESVDNEINEVAKNDSVVVIADDSVSNDMVAEEIITDEMVAEEIIGDEMDAEDEDEVIAENESIYDLSDCNQLVNEEISDVISTSATLDVASLLESGDFENISSPESFH